MKEKRFDTSFSRRQWIGLAASGALGTAGLKGLETGAAASTSDHRITLRAGDLEAMVVDNHDGLAGDQQKKRREAIPQVAGELGRLSCTVPFEERFNGYNGIPRLKYRDSSHPFSTPVSGLNCEFFFDEKRWSFEPRWKDIERFQAQPSRLKRVSDSEAHLKIDAGEDWGVEVETEIRLEAPYFVDLEHSFTRHERTGSTENSWGCFGPVTFKLHAIPDTISGAGSRLGRGLPGTTPTMPSNWRRSVYLVPRRDQ